MFWLMQDQYHKFIFNIRWKFSFTLSTKLKKYRNEKGISEKKTRMAIKNLNFGTHFMNCLRVHGCIWIFMPFTTSFTFILLDPVFYKQYTCILQTRENPIGASHSSYLLSYTASENLKRCNRKPIKFYNLRVI